VGLFGHCARIAASVRHGAIHFGASPLRRWRLEISRIAVVGTRTVQHEDGTPDRRVVLIRDDGVVREAPLEAGGVDAVLYELEKVLGITLLLEDDEPPAAGAVHFPLSLRHAPLLQLPPASTSRPDQASADAVPELSADVRRYLERRKRRESRRARAGRETVVDRRARSLSVADPEAE
jgi:hypothetical protein